MEHIDSLVDPARIRTDGTRTMTPIFLTLVQFETRERLYLEEVPSAAWLAGWLHTSVFRSRRITVHGRQLVRHIHPVRERLITQKLEGISPELRH